MKDNFTRVAFYSSGNFRERQSFRLTGSTDKNLFIDAWRLARTLIRNPYIDRVTFRLYSDRRYPRYTLMKDNSEIRLYVM